MSSTSWLMFCKKCHHWSNLFVQNKEGASGQGARAETIIFYNNGFQLLPGSYLTCLERLFVIAFCGVKACFAKEWSQDGKQCKENALKTVPILIASIHITFSRSSTFCRIFFAKIEPLCKENALKTVPILIASIHIAFSRSSTFCRIFFAKIEPLS